MHLVVGLGNPGREYEGTRHNVGFDLVDLLARKFAFRDARQEHKAETQRGTIGGHEVLLVKPLTFMNLSGEAVGALARYYKVPVGQVVVAHDELDFEPGLLRVKAGGGAGGHNGLRSLVSHLGADFVRLRLGVGKPPAADRGAGYVLSRFRPAERQLVDEALARAVEAVEVLVTEGLAPAMNRFNRKEPGEA